MHRLALCFATVTTACGGAQMVTSTVAAQPPKVDPGLPAGPPLITPGEHMTYKLALQGVELAQFDIAVGEQAQIAGKPAIVVQSHARAVGLVQMIANVDDTFTSWLDVATGRPLRYTTDEFAAKGSDKERTEVGFAERAGNTVPVAFHLNDAAAKAEPQVVSLPDLWDFNSFIVAVRVWSPPVGSTVGTEVFRSRYMWHIDLKVHGKERVSTALGTLPALRLDGHMYKLDRDGKKDPGSDERDFSIWVSDDDGRVPLQTVARTDYGDIKMEITDYSPGSGPRLRP